MKINIWFMKKLPLMLVLYNSLNNYWTHSLVFDPMNKQLKKFILHGRYRGDYPLKSGFKCKKDKKFLFFLWFKGLSRHLVFL
jgi:hypothetical protein